MVIIPIAMSSYESDENVGHRHFEKNKVKVTYLLIVSLIQFFTPCNMRDNKENHEKHVF